MNLLLVERVTSYEFTNRKLPARFLRYLASLERSYLTTDDPIKQSGFGGGPERWRQEREPLLDAVESDGDMLDIGCANGYLLECLMEWGAERGVRLHPYGLDISRRLIELARKRLPRYASHFYVANAWDWRPTRRFEYVYSVYDSVPDDYLAEFAHRVLRRVVAPGGRLILGAYGSRSQGIRPFDLEKILTSSGFIVAGSAIGGQPAVSKFVWVDSAGSVT